MTLNKFIILKTSENRTNTRLVYPDIIMSSYDIKLSCQDIQ
jgi:hypothetical protein